MAATKVAVEPMLSFITKVTAVRVAAQAQHAQQQQQRPLREQAFAAPQKVAEVVAKVRRAAGTRCGRAGAGAWTAALRSRRAASLQLVCVWPWSCWLFGGAGTAEAGGAACQLACCGYGVRPRAASSQRGGRWQQAGRRLRSASMSASRVCLRVQVNEALTGALPATIGKMRQYLPNPSTHAILFKPVKSNIAEAHGQVRTTVLSCRRNRNCQWVTATSLESGVLDLHLFGRLGGAAVCSTPMLVQTPVCALGCELRRWRRCWRPSTRPRRRRSCRSSSLTSSPPCWTPCADGVDPPCSASLGASLDCNNSSHPPQQSRPTQSAVPPSFVNRSSSHSASP